jgi:hypothetical protein
MEHRHPSENVNTDALFDNRSTNRSTEIEVESYLTAIADPNQPFRDVSVRINSDKNYWSRQLKELFAEAGIKTVMTEIRERDAHAHMLRDTFARALPMRWAIPYR